MLRAVLWNLKRIFNPEKQAQLGFQEIKEGKDVLIWGKGDYWIDRNNSTVPPFSPTLYPRHNRSS